MQRFLITQKGYNALKEELHRLKTIDRVSIVAAISEARSHGDLSENAEYHAAIEKQSMIESKIADLESKFSRAEVIIPNTETDVIRFGATVELESEDTPKVKMRYTIAGNYEADPEKGVISAYSPVGRSMIGRVVGDDIMINERVYIVTSVLYITD
ncbi:Transcription elongation factor GreA [Candidatus Fokinia solitaria]|uniref:Transcription elongation factor GreA n=1 Tax=Candidatus Fokinia solitaria TaxID=1802984 RepID=A0A2U8BS46_9RICK|nr:transcription elongation factor GreA [Candidatus Fokinia solitaria]AWD33169.1 Transcription elongation factor GreA [Candidatus Fokinia solitaria]